MSVEGALEPLPAELREAFRREFAFQALRVRSEVPSSIDGATKLVLTTAEGFLVESVILRPATGRIALCVSSQVGCAAACRFCATGHMGIARDLSAADILDQVAYANRRLSDEGRRVRNIVFMGMGEPMHNEPSVRAALRVLQSPKGFGHPPSRVLVSTVGVPEALVRTATDFPLTNFALSLHSARQDVRESIVPLARRHSLEALREAVIALNRLQPSKRAVMIEHVMLAGINDAESDVGALLDWLSGLRVHVNLIPFNRVQSAPHLSSSSRDVIERFGRTLRSAGYPTTIRRSLGHDVEAACGQLVKDENRQIARTLAQGASATSSS